MPDVLIGFVPQLLFDVDHAYAEFFRSLSGKDGS